MKNVKISLGNVQGRLNRTEMKMVVAGLEYLEPVDGIGSCSGSCNYMAGPNSPVSLIGTCVNNTNSIQVGCACKTKFGNLQPRCN